MHNRALAGSDANMPDLFAKRPARKARSEYEISSPEFAHANRAANEVLLGRTARQPDALSTIGPLHQSGAIDHLGPITFPCAANKLALSNPHPGVINGIASSNPEAELSQRRE